VSAPTSYAWLMADEHKNSHKPAIGIVGALAAIASIWWFALRPRRRGGSDSTPT
jgi:hypothetical protein